MVVLLAGPTPLWRGRRPPLVRPSICTSREGPVDADHWRGEIEICAVQPGVDDGITYRCTFVGVERGKWMESACRHRELFVVIHTIDMLFPCLLAIAELDPEMLRKALPSYWQ